MYTFDSSSVHAVRLSDIMLSLSVHLTHSFQLHFRRSQLVHGCIDPVIGSERDIVGRTRRVSLVKKRSRSNLWIPGNISMLIPT